MLLQSFLEVIRQFNLDAYMNPIADEHFNEIIGPCDSRVKTLTGYTGTYGTAITGANNAFFTTYQFLEKARTEIKDYQVIEDLPDAMNSWIVSNGIKRIGISSKLMPSKIYKKLYQDLNSAGVELVPFTDDLFDKVWKDKPKRVFNEIFDLQSHKYNEFIDKNYIKQFPEFKINDKAVYDLNTIIPGENYRSKLKRIRQEINEDEGYVIANLSTLGWLTNLRGNDLDFSSAFYSFGYLTKKKFILFTNNKIERKGITSKPYDEFYPFLSTIKEKKIFISGDVNFFIYEKLKNPEYSDLVEIYENLKNKTEIFGFKMSGVQDSKAIIQLLALLENSTVDFTELEIQDKLIEFKKQNKGYFSESFKPIIASGSNSSKIYHEATNKIHKKDEILLLDVGSHYMYGTTDITRTVCLGEPSPDMIRFYTITLKSLIKAKYIRKNFIQGKELDDAARYFLKKIGKNYITSTGHGVGFFAQVHEKFPKMDYDEDTLAVHNVFTIEPTYYDANLGIRIEDQVILNESDGFVFQTNLSFVPFQMNMIDNSMLTEAERKLVNLYSRKMLGFLSPLFDKKSPEYKYLVENTQELPNVEQTKDENGEIYNHNITK